VLQSSALHKAARDIMRNSFPTLESPFFAFFFQRSPTRKADKTTKRSIYFFANRSLTPCGCLLIFLEDCHNIFFSIEIICSAIFQKNRAEIYFSIERKN
jgi:hypothetical protein